ncbi:C40 family peptidase [Cohnella hongkongensis]|uniref:C40 family peptidase n=1 Tax=Cohnella hongkongensis TaxID=178337 RepID=A0ABV9FJD9_9BACL
MKKIKSRILLKSVKRISRRVRVLKRGMLDRKRTARYKEHDSSRSSTEQTRDRIHARMQRTASTVVRVKKILLVKMSKRWLQRYRFHQTDKHVVPDSRPIIRVKLLRKPAKQFEPRMSRRKRRVSPDKAVARPLRADPKIMSFQPAGKKKSPAHTDSRTRFGHDEKTKAPAQRRMNSSSVPSSFSGRMKLKGDIRKRRTLKILSPAIKSIRSSASGEGNTPHKEDKHFAPRKQMMQSVMQARRSIQWSRAEARMNLRLIKMLVKATTLLLKGLSVLLGGSSVVIILLCIVMVIAAVLSSPFGIFVADENSESGTNKIAFLVEDIDAQFAIQIESVKQAAGDVDRVEIHYVESADNTRIDNWPDVLAVFAVKTSTDKAGFDVVTMDRQRVEMLQTVFWDMNQIDSHVETLEHTELVFIEKEDGSIEEHVVTEYERVLQLSITARTADQQASHYDFSTEQVDLVNELLSAEFRPMMFAILGKNADTGLTSEQFEAIMTDLPAGVFGSQAVELALTRLGDPYSQLKAGQDNYTDCSYLVQWVYRQLDVTLPRTAAEQGRFIVDNGLSLTRDELLAGDLIFWSYEQNGRFIDITHVGIYAGNGKVIDASSSRLQVVYRNIFDADFQVLYGRPYFPFVE